MCCCVWVVEADFIEKDGPALRLLETSDSPLVRGLIVLLCDFYSEATPAEVVATEPELFEQLNLARNLSPTRLNGLASVRETIRAFAASCL